MKECIGLILIFSAIIILGVFGLDTDADLKERVLAIIILEIFVCLVTFGAYLIA